MLALLATLLVPAGAFPALPAAARDTQPDPTAHQVSTWKIDVTHSELLFRIRHLVSKVTGTFTEWEGTILADPADWKDGTVSVVIRSASISTNNQRRDTHLRSPDFFDAETYPQLVFRSTAVSITGDQISINGDLTIRGTTRPVVLRGTFNGIAPSGDGRDRVGFEVSTAINRLDYGLTWNRAVEGGGMLLGDEVTIQVTVEAVRQVG
jgi:polyisoprenoid-binding protein YceI